MSIIQSFDDESEEIIKPSSVVQRIENFPETVVVTYSRKIFNMLVSLAKASQISDFYSVFDADPIHKISLKGKEIAVYKSLLGGSGAAALMEEAIAKGGKKFLFFGSCGTLDKKISAGHMIVPTAAYRDEGTSYHYAPPSDYIEIPTADKLALIFERMDIPFVKAKTWTTDAFYRETRKNMLRRRIDGCVAVEMKCASVAAVAQFRNVEFYQFLYSEDSLAGTEWDPRIMGKLTRDDRERYMRIALEVAKFI